MKWLTFVLSLTLSLNLQAARHSSNPLDRNNLQIEEFDEDEIEGDELSAEELGDLEEIIADEDLKSMEIDEEDAPSLPVEVDEVLAQDEPLVTQISPFDSLKEQAKAATQTIQVNFRDVFRGAPIIYMLLSALSIASICIFLYSMLSIRTIELLPPSLIKDLRSKLLHNQYNEALDICVKENHFFCKMLASGILVRKHGLSMMVDTMKAEGKRSTISFWQRIGLLNDIALIAPLIGLLGTVLGMFYAFYDLNRSVESVSLLFDGLGISVGTTVAGLIVAIVAMILHTTAKYRLVRVLTNIENETQTFAALIETRSPNYLETL